MNASDPCAKCGSTDRYKCGACRPCKLAYTASRAEITKQRKRKVPTKPCRACGQSDRYANGRCKPCQQKKNADWLARNAERAKATAAVYRAVHKPHKNAKGKARYWANRDREIALRAAYRANNPDKVRAQARAQRQKHREKRRAAGHLRRVKKRISGKLSRDIVQKLWQLQKGKCACCRQPLGRDFHVDHIVPIARGGTNTDDNVQLLRAFCNQSKGAKHPVVFMQSRGFLL